MDTLEVQLPGQTLPSETCLDAVAWVAREHAVALSLAPVLPREAVSGKQLRRTRTGYRRAELAPLLGRRLAERDQRIDRVLCRAGPSKSPWRRIAEVHPAGLPAQIGAVDWAVDLPAGEPGHTARAVEAVFAAALAPGGRVFLEPLIDLDRTMDVSHGLLDRLCNPRPAFHAVRRANTVLFSAPSAPAEAPAAARAGDGQRRRGRTRG